MKWIYDHSYQPDPSVLARNWRRLCTPIFSCKNHLKQSIIKLVGTLSLPKPSLSLIIIFRALVPLCVGTTWKMYEKVILFKEDLGAWIRQNKAVLLDVQFLELILPEEAVTISDSIELLCNLRSLRIRRGKCLKYLPHSLTRLSYLNKLSIENCPMVQVLPSFYYQYWNLNMLPENMWGLFNLNSLKLESCGIMCIPTGLCNLKSLTISYCPVDFQVIKELVSLTYLSIGCCHIQSLKGFTTGPSSFRFCNEFEELAIELNTLVSLQILSIRHCGNLKLLPSIGALHQLVELNLSGCLHLNELPVDFDQLTNLSSLSLVGTNIQSLPSTITKLTKLEDLYLPVCFKLETLPIDLNFSSIRVYIPTHYRLDTLPTKFSAILEENHYRRLHLKAAVNSVPDLLPDDERISENTNQQTSCSVDGETLESEGEGHQPQVIPEGSSSTTEKCLANSKDDNETPSKKCKRAQKEITSEQTKSPMDQKVPRKNRKINKEDVVQLSGSMTRAAAAHNLKIPEGTFNQYLRCHDIKWPYTRGKKQRQTGLTQRVKQSSDIFVIKAKYAGDTVKFECSSTTSMDEVRNKVREKLKLEQKRFKLNYEDEDNEMILMTDDFNLKDAFNASTVKDEKCVRIWVLLDVSD